jgi:hypothetical protein
MRLPSPIDPVRPSLEGPLTRRSGKLDRAPGAGDTIDGVWTEQERQLLATGEFSRRSGLSLKALRIYDENGLLKPAEVDPGSGRRGYAPDQIRAAWLTEPAHDEAFTTITKAQWDYPAILAVYDAVACSPEVSGRPRSAQSGSALSCREVYVADPAAIGPDENVCDIAYPLG